MFGFEKKQIIIFASFLIVLAAIPFAALMVKQTQIFKSSASEEENLTLEQQIAKKEATSSAIKTPTASPSSLLSDLQRLLQVTPTPPADSASGTDELTPTPTPEVGLAFGPTLNITLSLEGRPAGKQTAKVFVGLSSGTAQTSPTYLLTFTVDFPDSGVFKGLSLAGLNPGSTYTAYIKGPAQIDSASTFVMGPTETSLNNNQALLLTSGDLNEDNTINSADYTLAKNLYGTTSVSRTWDSRADFNLDGIINNLDLSYIIKNFGKTGASGTWYSPPPTATQSGSPSGNYWLWVP